VGSLTAGGNLTAAGTLASAGAINAAAIAFDTGTFTATNLVAAGAFTNAGVTTLTGSLTATSVTQSAGSLSAATLSTTGAFALQAGTATIAGSGSLASTSITLGDNTTLTAPVINNSGLITLGTGAVLNLNHNRDITLAAPISGTGSLTVSTSNVITLSGAFGLPAVNVSGNTLALKGVVSTASDFTKSGTGLLILSAVNTYTGATFVNGGTLRINSNGALGAAAQPVTVAAGGTLDLSGSVVANNINLAGRTVTIAGTGVGNAGSIVNNSNFTQTSAIQALTLSADASIGGTQGWNVNGSALELAGFTLTKTGSNTIAIEGPSITEGNLTVAQGKLSILGGTQVLAGTTLPGVITVQSGATLELGGSVNSFGFTRAVSLLTGSTLATAPSAAISTGSAITVAGAVTLNIGANGSFNPAVAITGTANLTKTGYGRLILASLVDHDITGNLTITEGNVQVADSLGLPSGTITLTAQPGADANRRTRLELGTGVTVANNIVINGHAAGSLVGTGAVMLTTSTDIATVSGSITFNAGVTSGGSFISAVDDTGTIAATGYLALTGDLIAGTAQPTVRKGTILLNPTGTGSSYSQFIMQEGTLRLGKNNALLTSAEILLGVYGAGSSVDLNGFSQDFIKVTKGTLGATITNTNTTTMGVANFTNTVETTYAGTLANGVGGLGLVRLNKIGTGNLILTGVNTHKDGTFLTTGTLELRGTTILAANTIVDVAAGTTLKITSANADLTMAANITGTGTVRIDSNISGAAGPRSVTLSGNNLGFTGTYILEPTPSGVSTPNTSRINVTNGNTFGTANVVIKDRAQVWMQGGTYANNFTITGWGFADSQAVGGTPALGLNLTPYAGATPASGGIGAFRFNANTIVTGTVTLDGDAKVMAYGATASLNGSLGTTNATDRLIIGGGGSDTTIVLGGTNNAGTNPLRGIWINSGGGTSSSQLTIGGGTAAGTLGTGKVTLYTDATQTGVSVLNIRRTDGYTMEAGQLVEAVAPVGLSTNMSKAEFRANTTGTGLTLNGAQIILSNLTNAGGTFKVATEVDGAIVTIDAGSLLKVNQIQIAEGTNLGGTVNQTGGTVQQFASTGMRIGHWAGRVSTYNLSGGSIEMVNPAPGSAPNGAAEQAGGIYVGVDGVGVFNQTGGSIKTPWMVLDNRGANAAIDGIVSSYNLSAGTLEFTAGTGLISNNLLTGTASWSGGTMRNSAPSANVAINTNIVVTGTTAALDTVDATRGFVFNREVTGGGTVTTSGGGTVYVTTAATQTFDLVMAGTSGLTKQGTGTTTLIGNQTYSGPTLVSTGTLSLAGNIPNSDLTVSAGANLQGLGTAKSIAFGNFTSFSADPSASSILAATNAFSVATGGLVTVNLLGGPATSAPFAILNYGSTTATGANFALSGAGSYRNPPTFNVGATSTTLALGFGELVWTNGGANANWDAASNNFFNIGTSLADKFIFGDIVTFDDSLGVSQGVNFVGNIRPTTTIVNNSTYDYTLTSSAGNTLGGYGQVIKRGTGVLNMAGVANTFTGGTLLSAGRINVGAAGSLGTGRITLGATDSAANAVSLYISGARVVGNLTNAILVSSNAGGVVKIGSDVSVTGTGAMGFSGITLQRDLILDSNAADRTDYAGITGTGNVTFIGTTRSILGLGLANTFTGNVTLSGTGNVQVGAATAGTLDGIPDNATLTINTGSTFVMSAGAEIIGGLSGTGSITTNQYAGTLTVGTGNATSTFSGVIGDTAGYALGLNKVGTGTLTLAGANTFTGAVQVGTLVAPGGTLELTGANAFGALTVFAGTVKVGAPLNNTGNITLNSGAMLDVLAAARLFNGAYTNAATVTVNAGATWRMDQMGYGVNFSGQLADYAARRVLNGGTIIVTGDTPVEPMGNNFTVNVTTGGTFRYAPTNVGQTLTFAGNANSDIALNGPLALQVVGGSLAINENIVGAGSITKTGNGKLTLGGVNTFTGNLVISEGEFNVNGAYALGRGTVSLPAGVTLDNTSGADVNVATDTTITLGDGVLNFTGTNSLSLGYGTIALPANTTVNVTAKTLSLDGPVAGAFGITKTGAGTLALHAPSNTFTGGVTVNGGLLSIGKYVTGSAGTGAVVFNGGGIAFDDYQALRTFDLAGNSLGAAVPTATVISANFSSIHNTTGDIVPLNTTRGFVGKLYLPAGTWNFQEAFDDGVALKVNNSVILNNAAYNVNTTGSFTATTAGWYDIDLRVYQGTGGTGAVAPSLYGVGIANGAGAYVPFTTAGLASLGVIATVGTTPGFSYAGDISLLQNGSISSTNLGNYDFTLSGVISGPADLTKLGAGTIVLTGANTYTGKTIVQEGTLALTGSANATTGIEVNGGFLRLDSATAIPAGGVILNGGGLKFNLGATTAITVNNLTINAAATIDTTGLDVTFGGPLTGTGSLVKAGTGTTPGTLTLANGSTFAGTTTITGGKLVIASGSALGAPPVTATAGQLTFAGGSLQTTANVTLAANRGIALDVNSTGLFLPDAATTLTVDSIIASGPGTGTTSGKLALGSATSGAIILNGVNTYAGDTDLLGSTVTIGNDAAFGAGVNLNLPAGVTAATLQFAGTATGTLTKVVNVLDTLATLTIAGGTKDITLSSGLTGAGTLVQTGSGKLILGGTSLFAGFITADNTIVLNTATAIAGGNTGASLRFGSSPSYAGAGTIVYGTGVTTDVSNLLSATAMPALTVDTGANNVTWGSAVYGAFILTKKGAGELNFEGLDPIQAGSVNIAAGTLTMAKSTSLNGVVSSGAFGTPAFVTFTGDATLKYATGVTTDVSSVLVSNVGKTGTIDIGANNVTFAGALSGAGSFEKIGSGTLTLAATNAFTGGFKLTQGTLEIAGTDVFLGSAGLSFTGNSTLKFAAGNFDDISNGLTVAATKTGTIDTNGNDVTFANAIGGTGSLIKDGAGVLTLDAATTLTGALNVNAGTLALTAFGGLATPSSITIGTGAALDTTARNGFSLASGQALMGAGTVNVGSTKTLTVATGSTLNATGLSVTGKLTLAGTYAATLGAPGTALAPNAAAQTTVSGNVTLGGTLSLTSNGAGAGAYQIINGSGTTTGNFTAFNLAGINNALLHQEVVTTAGVTGVNLVRVATTTGTLPTTVNYAATRPAAAAFSTTLNFANTATADGFSEALTGTVSANGTGFTTAAAGTTGVVTLGLDSLTAGAKSGSSIVTVSSVGVGTFANTSLVSGTVALSGSVYDYATATIADATLAFGNVHVGATAVTRNVSVTNTKVTDAAYQDNLSATATAVTGLSVNTLSALAADTSGNLVFTASAGTAGSLAGAVTFTLNSTNTVSGLDAKSLTTTANVTTTGQVYSGLSTWNATSGSWGRLVSGFGTNWGTNQGSPGLDAAFANVDTATFDNTVLANNTTGTVSLDGAAPSLNAITFNTTGGGYTLDAGSGGALTLASASGNATIAATSGNHTIATDLTLSSAVATTVGTGAKLTLSGAVSGTVGLAKSGAGTLTLAGNNAGYTGAVTLAAGTLELNSYNAIINASALNVTGNSTLLYGTGNTTDVSAKLGTIAAGTTLTVDTNGNIVTYASAITSAGTLVKDNSGTLILGAANSLTGALNVTGGSVRLTNAGALGTAAVTVGAGSFLDLNSLNATGAAIVLDGGTLSRTSAYTGTVTFTAASLNSGLLSLAGTAKVGVLTGQTAAINGETRDIELNGGTLTGLSSFTGTLIVKSTLDASATISAGAVTLDGGTINLQGLNSTKSLGYLAGQLTNADNYTGNVEILGAVTLATGTLGNGVIQVGSGDTVTLANNGLNNAIALSGGTVDFNGKTATTSIAYTNGTLTNAAGYTGDVTLAAAGSTTLTAGSLGSARVIAPAGTTLDFAAGFNNAVRNTGAAVTNGTNYTGTMSYAAGQSIAVTADQVAKLAFESGTTAKGSGTLTALSFAAGSAYTMTMKDGAGVAGVGFDSVTITGALNLASLSSTNRMTLNVVSLDSANTIGGNIANQTFAWNDPKNFTLFTYGTLTLGNSVTNVADLFTVNYANFKDKYGVSAQSDWFTVSNDSVNGAIVLTAIPEPSTYGMSLAGLALALAAIRRRNKRKADAAK
jgi:autotransporter-associated beta strand protein